MSTSLTDGNKNRDVIYQNNHNHNPQQPSAQTQQQVNGRVTAPFQSNQSSDTAVQLGGVPQIKSEAPAVKSEPGALEQQSRPQPSNGGAQASWAPPAQGSQVTPGQLSQPVPGTFHAQPSLANSQRVVADYTGPGQAHNGPRPIPGNVSQAQPSFHPQQGLAQGLSSQGFPVQPGNPGAGHISGPLPAGGYPIHAQGSSHVPKPLPDPSSSTNGKQVSTSDIQRVQNYIEKCLQMYLTQKEVINQLQQQFKIEPCFTQLVWQKLEEQNQEFFRAYYTRLKLKDQIVLFNHLLDEQVKMFERLPRSSNIRPGSGTGLMNSHTGIPSAMPQQPLQPVLQQQSHPAPAAMGLSHPTSLAQVPPNSDANLALHETAHQLDVGEFSGLGMDSGSGELNPDLAALAQSLPFSGSEMNLAGMVSSGSMGRGLGSQDHLAGLPRNFSLSDLGLDHVMDGEHGGILPRNISLSDFPALDLDSGGEQN